MTGASRSTIWLAAAALFLAVEAVLIVFVDKPLSLWLRDLDAHDRAIIDVFRGYTNYAKADWYLWPSGIAGLACVALRRRKGFDAAWRKLAFFFTAVAGAGLLTALLKCLIGRARPVQLQEFGIYGFAPWNWVESRWHSLPSGEATTSFAVAVALIVLFPRWRIAFYLFALAMAGSRVMVNAHYLSDIVAGAVVGSLTAIAVSDLFARKGWLFAGGVGGN
jgi:undecaprenyl-diphosphatase